MDNIRIFKKNNVEYIDLPRTKNISYAEQAVAYETEMASGKLVQDIMGVRPTFTVKFDYVTPDTLRDVVSLLRQGGFFTVVYPTPLGNDEVGVFKIEENAGQKVFKFVGGQPMWYGMSLTFTSQVVIEVDS